MSIKDVADLLFAARERVDFYWNFYVVVGIAVIGWLVSLKKTLTLSMKLLVSVVYVIAAGTNLLGLYSSYTFAEALRTDLVRMAATTPLSNTHLLLEQHTYLPQRLAAICIHVVVGVTILLVVWFARFSEPEATPAKATPSNAEGENSQDDRRGRAGIDRRGRSKKRPAGAASHYHGSKSVAVRS
jgi:hypothetical protein